MSDSPGKTQASISTFSLRQSAAHAPTVRHPRQHAQVAALLDRPDAVVAQVARRAGRIHDGVLLGEEVRRLVVVECVGYPAETIESAGATL